MKCKVSFKFSLRLGSPLVQSGKRRALNIAHNERKVEELKDDWNKDGHIHEELSHLNEQLVDYELDEFLRDELTDKILQHNAKCEKQRHKERCVDTEDFISQVRGKAQEVVMQLGDTTEFNQLCAERGVDEARRIHGEFLRAAFEWWKQANPQYKVFNATIHFDEAVPHLHLDFVPICDKEKRLGYIVSRKGALREMGFKSKSEAQQKSDFMYTRWAEYEHMAELNTPNFITIEPSEPNVDDGKDPPEWRKKQYAKDLFNTQMDEMILQQLATIPPQPPLYQKKPFPEVLADEPVREDNEGAFGFGKRHKQWEKERDQYAERKAAWDKNEDEKAAANKAERAEWVQEHGLQSKVVKQAEINVQDKLENDTERGRNRRQAQKNKRDRTANSVEAARLVAVQEEYEAKQAALELDKQAFELSKKIEKGHRNALYQPINARNVSDLAADTIRGFRKDVNYEQQQRNNGNLCKHDTYELGG